MLKNNDTCHVLQTVLSHNRTKEGKTMIYKTLHIKLKIEQQETIKYGVNSDAPEAESSVYFNGTFPEHLSSPVFLGSCCSISGFMCSVL